MIRLLKSEKQQLDHAATSEGLATASWARKELLKTAKNRYTNTLSIAENSYSENPLSLLSLFCGPGGLDQGFKDAGFHTRLAFDIHEDSVNTFAYNHPESKAFVRDLNDLTVEDLDSLNGAKFQPFGVIGGPPCQSFSVSNVHQTDDDPRHKLPEVYANLLKKLNDRYPISFFLFENVPGLLGKKHIHRYTIFKEMFEKAGFEIYESTLDAKNYGVPQERPRIFIVGINKVKYPNVKWMPPEPEKKIKTVEEAIKGLAEPIYNERGLDPDTFPVHPNHWCLVPRSDKFKNGKLEQGQMFGRSFRTLSWDKPSWTVAYGHREVHVHPNGHRRLSIYEAMKLQSFPDEYRLMGNMSSQIKQISEAVAVRVAWHIARSIRKSLGAYGD